MKQRLSLSPYTRLLSLCIERRKSESQRFLSKMEKFSICSRLPTSIFQCSVSKTVGFSTHPFTEPSVLRPRIITFTRERAKRLIEEGDHTIHIHLAHQVERLDMPGTR